MYIPPSLPKKTSEPTNESTIATATDMTSSHNSPTSSTTVSNTTPTPTDSDSNSNPLYTLPAPYDVADGFILFMDSFLYLGTLFTPDLCDETDVRSRIKKATAQVGALRTFFLHPTLTLLETKTTVYTAMALNMVLWGCKAWTTTDSIKCTLQVFHHRRQPKKHTEH
jgi:hypothetical protein